MSSRYMNWGILYLLDVILKKKKQYLFSNIVDIITKFKILIDMHDKCKIYNYLIVTHQLLYICVIKRFSIYLLTFI